MNKDFPISQCNICAQPFASKRRSQTVGERIREAVISKMPLDQSGAPFFEEAADSPTHNMVANPDYSFTRDNFDRAQQVIDELGEAVDMNRVSRDAAAAAAAAAERGEDPAAAAAAVRAAAADEE